MAKGKIILKGTRKAIGDTRNSMLKKLQKAVDTTKKGAQRNRKTT